MFIVGELINSSRKTIQSAIQSKDSKLIKDLAKRQIEAGADYIDVNCGTQVYDEGETIQWLVKSIQEVTDAPLCIDSPSEKTLAAGLNAAQGNGKKQMVNSITAESARYQAVLPLIQKFQTKIVALCMDDQGMPETAKDRMRIVDQLVANLTKDRIDLDHIYLDPLVKPISVGDQSGQDALQTVRYIREQYPQVHIICGLSNISFGLPNRKFLNRTFMIQTMTMGMDAYILDPLDKEMMGLVFASQALLGQDPYCGNYLKAHRKGLYQ
jgi:cobalamin-dependent methionine synthase I